MTVRTRRILSLVSLVVGLLLVGWVGVALVASGSGHRAAAPSSASATTTSTPSPSPSGAATASSTPTASASASPGAAAVLDLTGQQSYLFASPSGNIVCHLGSSSVRCSTADRQWTPPAPDGCRQAHDDLALTGEGKAVVVCHTDTIRPAAETSAHVLAYGRAVKMGDILCFSQTNGMSCSNTTTGSSIFMARERYEVNNS